eukprot:749830-Hanusia_phi.AAC.2
MLLMGKRKLQLKKTSSYSLQSVQEFGCGHDGGGEGADLSNVVEEEGKDDNGHGDDEGDEDEDGDEDGENDGDGDEYVVVFAAALIALCDVLMFLQTIPQDLRPPTSWMITIGEDGTGQVRHSHNLLPMCDCSVSVGSKQESLSKPAEVAKVPERIRIGSTIYERSKDGHALIRCRWEERGQEGTGVVRRGGGLKFKQEEQNFGSKKAEAYGTSGKDERNEEKGRTVLSSTTNPRSLPTRSTPSRPTT